jgi:Holliday junction resolvase RusA-like endonuclease
MLTFDLPWPDSALSPNRSKGHHWGATHAAKKIARESAFVLTKIAKKSYTAPSGEIPLTLVFVQPNKTRMDLDNLLSSMKSALDGVAKALRIDDVVFMPVTISREYGGKPGHVRVTIG